MKLLPRTKKDIVASLARVATCVAVVFTILYFIQERILFMPSTLADDAKFDFIGKVEEHAFEVEGKKAHSLIFDRDSAKGLILFLHGNAGDLSDWGYVAEELVNRTGYGVWIVDYPGFGKSRGKIASEGQLHAFARSVYGEVQKILGNRRLIIYGRSIGTGLAVRLASENKADALILESPYLSMTSLVSSKLAWLPSFLLRYPLPSNTWITQVNVPVLVVHGEKDEVIPVQQGESLAKLAKNSEFHSVKEAHHNDLRHFDEYWGALQAFLGKLN